MCDIFQLLADREGRLASEVAIFSFASSRSSSERSGPRKLAAAGGDGVVEAVAEKQVPGASGSQTAMPMACSVDGKMPQVSLARYKPSRSKACKNATHQDACEQHHTKVCDLGKVPGGCGASRDMQFEVFCCKGHDMHCRRLRLGRMATRKD